MKVYIVIHSAWNDVITAFTTKEKAEEYCKRQDEKLLFPAKLFTT